MWFARIQGLKYRKKKKLNPNSCLMTVCSDRTLNEFYRRRDCIQNQWKDPRRKRRDTGEKKRKTWSLW